MPFMLLLRSFTFMGLLSFLLLGCATSNSHNHGTEIIVASERVDCIDKVPQQCFLIKPKNNKNSDGFDDQWHYFFGNIIGLDYKEGTEYRLLVQKEVKKHAVREENDKGDLTVKRILAQINQRSKNIPETLHYSVRRK